MRLAAVSLQLILDLMEKVGKHCQDLRAGGPLCLCSGFCWLWVLFDLFSVRVVVESRASVEVG